MKPAKLFWTRVWNHWQFQRKVTGLVIDWVIAVYLVIPVLIALIYQYVIWCSHFPAWMRPVPFAFLAVIFGLYAETGALRTYVDSADQLFLVQRPRWMRALKHHGLLYSLLLSFISCAALTAWLGPLLLHRYHYTMLEIVFMFLLTWLDRSVNAFIRFRIELRFDGWQRILMKALGYAVSFGVFLWLVLWTRHQLWKFSAVDAALLVLLALLVRQRLRSPIRFLREAEYEAGQRMKLLSLVLIRSGSVQRKPRIASNRPMILTRSNRFFRHRSRENVLTETALKSFMRSFKSVSSYLRFTLLGAGAVLLSPGWAKWVIVLGAGVLAGLYAKSHWKEVKEEEYIRWFPWSFQDLTGAGQKTILILTLPMLFVITFIASIQLLPAWGFLASVPIAFGIAYLFSFIFSMGT